MSAIFISYRRDDSEGQAGRLFDELTELFGADAVFMDVATIEPGRDFRRAIDEHVAACGVLLAIIGKGWLTARDGSGARRLDDPMDFVRLETASALRRDIPVVPVLVHGATMPRADDLPEDLQALAFRNAVELRHASWESDVQQLARALRPHVRAQPSPMGAPAAAPAAAPPKTPTPRRAAGLAALVAIVAGLVFGGYQWREQSRLEATIAAAGRDAGQAPAAGPPQASAPVPSASSPTPVPVAEVVATVAPGPATPASVQAPPAPSASTAARARPTPPAARLRWRLGNFPPPNAGSVLFAIMPSGDPACASYDGRSCLWGVAGKDVEFARLRPLVCGAAHQALYRTTGYEDPRHWCSLARKAGTR